MIHLLKLSLAAVGAIALSSLALAAPAAVASPATDEYSLDIPDGRGGGKLEPKAPTPDESKLPPSVRDKLGTSRLDQTLVQVGTAPELGAPESPQASDEGGAEGNPSEGGAEDGLGVAQRPVTAIAGDEASSNQGLVVLLAMVGIGAVGVLLWLARRRASARPID